MTQSQVAWSEERSFQASPSIDTRGRGSRFARTSYDVVVAGGGPAGCAAAAILAQGGASVLLLERSELATFKVGESLMPETYWVLERMGALKHVQAAGFVEKHSVEFFSKNGKGSAPFYFDSVSDHESAMTWQVLREKFDDLLLKTAEEQGAEVHRGCAVRRVLFDDDRARALVVRWADRQEEEIACRVVVDATGQGNLISKAKPLERVDYNLRNASIFTHFRGAFRNQGRDEGATIILHTREGDSWFWYIPLADDIVSVGVVGEQQSLITDRKKRPDEIFLEEVEKCTEIKRRIKGAVQTRPMQVLKDFSYKNKQIAGEGWVLVGDAFSFIDPVYSSGVFLALKTGEMAAEAILEGLENDQLDAEQLGQFEGELQRGMDAVLGLVRSFYSPDFSFGGFLRAFPQHQDAVTKILIGDVFVTDFGEFFTHVDQYQAAGADRHLD